MMFDEPQVFKGLSAWFSASVPTRLRSQWVKNGGIHSNDLNDVDYIFSSNAAAEDTSRIFDSQTYQKEELTIFHSSLIEDTVTSGKSCLSGKYAGAYILIHPAYQREIDTFHKEQCPRRYRSNVKPLTRNEERRESCPNGTHFDKKGCFVWHQEASNDDQSDEWDFKDESHIYTSENLRKMHIEGSITQQHINEEGHSDEWDFSDNPNLMVARLQSENSLQCDRSNVMLHNSLQLNSNSTTVKRPRVEPPPNRKQEVTLKLARKGSSNHCIGESQTNYGNHSQNLMDHEREQDLFCGEHKRKSESYFQGAEERESFLDDTQLKNKAASEAPTGYSFSKFLSSMDDGFVHIDDIKLPDTPINDFIPNQNGCQVDPR